MSAGDRLRRNDRRLLAVMTTFTSDEWSTASLCHAWTNHQVLAHLVIGYSGAPATFVTGMYRHRWLFDIANAVLAGELAATHAPVALLEDFGELVDRPRGLGRAFPKRLLLGDHITHELDMLHALARQPAIAPDDLVAVLNTQVTLPNPFVPAYRNSRGLRLESTDVDWAHGGRGPLVRGRAADLVSVLGNRPARLPCLTGDGVTILAARIGPPDP